MLTDVLLCSVYAAAQLADVLVAVSAYRCGLLVGVAEDEVQRLAAIPAEEDLEGCDAGGPADGRAEREEGLWQRILPGVVIVSDDGAEHVS